MPIEKDFNINNETEIWKPVPNYENLYLVSNFGNFQNRITRKNKKTFLNKSTTYINVELWKNNQRKHHVVHKLVALLFLGEKPKDLEINHKDGNKLNNNASNLEYITHKENIHHAMRLGIKSQVRGQDHGMAKLTLEKVKEIRRLSKTGIHTRDIAKQFNLNYCYCINLISGRSWKGV